MTGRDAFFATIREALGRAPGDGPPDDAALLLATGRGFVVYAASFIQRPAERLPDRRGSL